MTDLEYLLLVVGRKGLLWACKVQAEAPGHTDACDLPLTFSQTSAGAEELTEVSVQASSTHGTVQIYPVWPISVSGAATKILWGFFLNLS